MRNRKATRLIVEAGPTTATYVTFVTPPISVLLGAVVLDEPLGWPVAVSMGPIAGCLLLLMRSYEQLRPVVEIEVGGDPRLAGGS